MSGDKAAGRAPGSLRRIDWRFLLPAAPEGGFAHLVLLGGDGEIAEQVLAVGLARRVSTTLPAAPSADLVVVLAGAGTPLADAARCLAPGGVLCCEVDRRLPGRRGATPRRTVRALRGAGLTPGAVYWDKRSAGLSSMFLPLASRDALAWYFDTIFTARSRVRRALRATVRTLAGWRGDLFGAVVPTYVVIARAGDAAPGERPAVLEQAALPARVRESGRHAVLLMSGQGDWSRIVLLPFPERGGAPVAVVKLPRTPEFNAQTENEQAVLDRLRSTLGPSLRDSVPEPCGVGRWAGLSVAVEGYVPGRRLCSEVAARPGPEPPAGAVEELGEAAEWLARLHESAPAEHGSWKPEELGRQLDRACAGYAAACGCTPEEARLFAALRRRAGELAGVTLPLVWHHRDFGPWNLYRCDGELRVIDWEVARVGPPLCDLLYLVMHWYWTVRGHTTEPGRQAALRRLFVEPAGGDALVTAARREIEAYVVRLGLDPRVLPVLLVYTLLEQAVDRAERVRERGAPEGSEDNPYAGYLGVLAREADRLFAPVEPARPEAAA